MSDLTEETVQQELQDYLSEHRVNHLFIKIVEALLMTKPDNPIEFVVRYLQKNYPKETVNVTPKDGASSSAAAAAADEEDEEPPDSDDDEDDDYVDELPDIKKSASIVRGRRTSVSAGVMSAASLQKKAPDVFFEKTKEERERLRKVLKANWLCSHLDDEQAKTVIDAMEKVSFQPGDVIIKQGDTVANHYFILDTGNAEVIKNEDKILLYEAGAGFGELALMYHAPRAATVRATEACDVWRLGRETFKYILFKTSTQKRDKYRKFLSEVQILQTLSEYERLTLADALVEESFTPGTDIVTQGEKGDLFYIIKEGTVQVIVNGKVVGELERGMYFGEISLVKNVPRQATIRATSNVETLCVSRGVFQRVFGKLSDLLQRNMSIYLKYCA